MPHSRKIKDLLVDDHLIVREGLRHTLGQFSRLEIVGEATNGREALHKVAELVPDVVLMDINMPQMNGLEATAELSRHFKEVKVLALTVHESRQYVFQILQSGARGYALKDASPEELCQAIESIHRGYSFLSPSVTSMVLKEIAPVSLTPVAAPPPLDSKAVTKREKQILALLTEGKTNKEIARLLTLSVRSVETFRLRLMRKLGVRNAAELVKYAFEHQLISREAKPLS
jgi:DNA-binding NarL/FixJ family response regulator